MLTGVGAASSSAGLALPEGEPYRRRGQDPDQGEGQRKSSDPVQHPDLGWAPARMAVKPRSKPREPLAVEEGVQGNHAFNVAMRSANAKPGREKSN